MQEWDIRTSFLYQNDQHATFETKVFYGPAAEKYNREHEYFKVEMTFAGY